MADHLAICLNAANGLTEQPTVWPVRVCSLLARAAFGGSGARFTSTRRVVTGVGAAIAVTGLKMALQTGPGNLYHTKPRPVGYVGPRTSMDDPRANDAPVEFRQPAAGVVPPGVDSPYDLVERAKSGDHRALNRLFARYL